MKPGVNWLVRRGAAWLKGIVWAAVLTASASIAGAPRELRVGVYSNEPKVFVDADGKAAGIFVDLLQLLIRHGLLQSPDAVQLEPVEGLRHLSPSKVYE